MAGPIVGAEVVIKVENPPGSGIFVYLSGQTNAAFQAQAAEIDASSKDSTESVYLPGRFNQTLTLDALYIPGLPEFIVLRTAQRNRQVVKIRRAELGSDTEECDAVITSMSETFPDNAASTINVQFRVASPWAGV